jgi:hypothetical protein
MKPPRPSAIMTLSSRTLNAAEAGLASLQVTLGRGVHDHVELRCWPRSKFGSASPGDALAIQLGVKDEEQDVWSGKVTRVDRTANALIITGHTPTAALSRERKAQTYVGQSVDDIVRDLAGSVDIDSVDGDASLSYYAVDHRRSVWGHLLDLADLTGCEITSSPAGGLRFRSVSALPSTTRFRFGAELLAWHVGDATQGGAPTFAAHGSGSESGSEKWHWLNPDPTGGAGGMQVVGAFHAKALGESLSTAVAERTQRSTLSGEVELTGQAALRAGDVFTLVDLPDGDVGPLRALRVSHVLNGVHGFRSRVRVEGVGG